MSENSDPEGGRRMTGFSLFLGLCLLAAPGCAGGSALGESLGRGTEAGKEVRPDVYRIRLGDELEVSIWGHENITRRVPIREDGTFMFPEAGGIRAVGRSLLEVEKDLQEKMNRHSLEEVENPSPESTPSLTPTRVISSAQAHSEVYRLRAGDELKVSVWDHDDLNQTVSIREDGTFSFPLIGDVQAAGRSLRQVEQEVQERLDRDYIVNPQVTVQLTGRKFSILGEVASPGSYPIEGTLDLLDALSKAGGLTKFASNRVEVIRENQGEKVAIQVHVDRILEGTEPNVSILPRDAIHVLGNPLVSMQVSVRLYGARFSVLGDVERPGSYPMEGPVDLLTAIGEAGGITKFGSGRIEIIRGQGEVKVTIRANLDRILQGKEPNMAILPRDTIYVRRRIF